MRQSGSIGPISLFLLLTASGLSAQETSEPLRSEKVEKEKVQLVLVDTVVVDERGRTVPGLTAEDFELLVAGRPVAVDTLDVRCDEGALDDPRGVRDPRRRRPAPDAAEPRRTVIALDYLHLPHIQRVDVLEQVMDMVRYGVTPEEEIMVAALTGDIRIEQPFTSDKERVLETLRRMEYDVSLWVPDFPHLTEQGFFEGLIALLDVAGSVAGSKALVLYSNMPGQGFESDFELVSAAAISAQCAIYPVHAAGLVAPRMVSEPPAPG